MSDSGWNPERTKKTVDGELEITGGFGINGVGAIAQKDNIVDADGTLADLTTKFNALKADLESYGTHATS